MKSLWEEPERTLKLWQVLPTLSAKRRDDESPQKKPKLHGHLQGHHENSMTVMMTLQHLVHHITTFASTLPAWSTGETWMTKAQVTTRSTYESSSHHLCCCPPWPIEAAHLPALRHHLAPLAVQRRGCCPTPDRSVNGATWDSQPFAQNGSTLWP